MRWARSFLRVTDVDIQVGDLLQMKKSHPCGSREWEVLRVGMDFKLRCCGCGHEIMLPRSKAEKNTKQHLPRSKAGQEGKEQGQ